MRPVPGGGGDDPLWFSSEPLDQSALESLLTRVLIVREVYSDPHRHPLWEKEQEEEEEEEEKKKEEQQEEQEVATPDPTV